MNKPYSGNSKPFGLALFSEKDKERVTPVLETLETITAEAGLDHANLLLEITESAYTENSEQIIGVVKALREKGFHVEMDDFGTGYSSLNMITTLPIILLMSMIP